MGWFNEQIKIRKQSDDAIFEDAFNDIANAILGKRLSASLKDQQIAQSAIEEILKFFNLRMPKKLAPDYLTDINDQLNFYLSSSGIMYRKVKLDKRWYENAFGPLLSTLKEDQRVVALIPNKLLGYDLVDITSGTKKRITAQVAKSIDKEAICFYYPLPQRKLTILDLMKFMFSLLSTSDLVAYLGMMILSTVLGFISPAITKILFSNIVDSKSISALIGISLFLFCYNLSALLIRACQSLINQRVSTKQNIIVQAAVMSRMMSLPVKFFKNYSSGELSSRASYVQDLCTTIMNSIGTTGLTSIFSLTYLTQINQFAPSLVIPSIIITLVSIVFTTITTVIQSSQSKKAMNLSTKESGISYSLITGIQKVKLAGAEKRAFSKWAKLYAQKTYVRNNPPVLVKYSSAISLAINLLGNLAIYYFAIVSKVSVSDYYAFNASYGMVSSAFSSLASIILTVANIKPILEMAKPILEAVPEVSSDKEIITKLNGSIELNNVSFRYTDDMPMVIDNLSLKINPGEYVAIVGSTGCGKSTLLRLLLGFEKPLKGSISYDNKDINKIDIQSLRQNLGVVMQDGKLFTGDIYSNIVISAPQLTIEDAWEAARIASIDKDIEEMPMGMHTLISEGQGGISGGQKQRLMIARAIAHKPKVLFFDEATSALDNITQKKVSEAIDSLKCTRIVIAHRLSTIKHCDRIIVLNNGNIVEDGTYEELIKNNKLFYDLVKRQRLDIDVD